MLRGFYYSKLVFLSTLDFTHSKASNAHIPQYQGSIVWVCGAHW